MEVRGKLLLVRAWLPARGCCHLRSPGLADAEARDLLDAAREAIERVQESGGIEELTGTEGRAFVMARRSPDPDHPNRQAPGFVLISIPDQDAFFRECVSDLLASVPFPETSDAVPEGWEFLDPGSSPREAKGESSKESRPARRLVASFRRFRGWRPKHLMNLLSALAVASLLSLVVCRRHNVAGRGEPPTTPSVESPGIPGADAMQWRRDRGEIKKLLQSPWARQILRESLIRDPAAPRTARDRSDRELLADFARLFRRPTLKLKEEDRRDFEGLESRDHPFIAFLNRLPVRPPEPPEGDGPLSTADALDYLKRLEAELKDLDLNLDSSREGELAQTIKLSLNYRDFYATWSKEDGSRGTSEPLDPGRESTEFYRWIGAVREVIRVYCLP